jgi:hypothetical protein
MTPTTRRARRSPPWDTVVVTHWAQTPEQTRVRTDAGGPRMGWPFTDGRVLGAPSLDDAHFEVYVDKVWALIQEEAARMPSRRRRPFLAAQQRRLDGYRVRRLRRAS